jgi:polysaccharide deacetylase 2 family uncharacterized protein YibQ
MPKRASRKTSFPRAALLLGGIAVAVFLLGQAFVLLRSEGGQLRAASLLRVGDQASLTRLIGHQVRDALAAVGVPADSIRERTRDGAAPRVVWRVGLAPDASLFQANYAVTKRLADHGAEVIGARERGGRSGETIVAMQVGMPGRATHEIELVRFPRPPREESDREDARVALVLYGFEDHEQATGFFALGQPFAVAIVPGGPRSQDLFRAARKRSREVVLHLPLEPLGYPRINPGPGTILVTMKPSTITGLVKRYLDQAGPVTAVANASGSLATQDMAVMTAVYEELRRRHVPFLHVMPAAGAVCRSLAADVGVSYEEPDAVIDGEARAKTPKALEARWKQVLAQSRERGAMVVMVRATPQVMEWLPRATTSKALAGVSLVPLASAIRTPPAL